MLRIIHTIIRPFRAAHTWQSDRGSWLSIPLRDHYMILKFVDGVTEGRLTEDQADVQLSAYAERREQEGNGLTSRECRGCNNGNGDGICEYHANMFRRSGQRFDHVQHNRPRY